MNHHTVLCSFTIMLLTYWPTEAHTSPIKLNDAQPSLTNLSLLKQDEVNMPASEEIKIVDFGSFQTAENLRLQNLFDYGFEEVAISEAVKYLQLNPQELDVRQTLAKFYSYQKKRDLANEQLQLIDLWKTWGSGEQSLAINKAIELINQNPKSSEINYALGYFYFSQKNYILAAEALEATLQKEPAFSAARAILINTYIAMGNYPLAATTLNQGWESNNNLFREEKQLLQHAQETYLENANTDFKKFLFLWHLWDSGRQQEAINQATLYLQTHPEQLQITLSLGQFYLLEKNFLLANRVLPPLLVKNPGYIAARATLIDLYLANNDLQQAQNTLNQGLILSPVNPLLIEKKKKIIAYQNSDNLEGSAATLAEFNSLWDLWKSGQRAQAFDQAESYLKTNPDDTRIRLVLGQFYALQKNYPGAIQQYNSILAKNPAYIRARISLSDAYVNTKNYNMASTVIEQGLLLIPDNPELLAAQQNMASFREFDSLWQLWHQGKQVEAMNQAKEYLKTHPDNVEINLSLGQFYFLQKNYSAAYQQINQILVENPNYVGARLSLIDVALAMKDYSGAENLLQEGLKLLPNDLNLQAEEKLIANARTQLTPTALPEVSTQKTGEALAEFNALWQLWKSGEQSTALIKALEYLKKDPDDTAIALSLGQFYFLQKNYALALDQIGKVLIKNPTYVAARASLIEVYIAMKDYKQATEILNQGFKLTPNDSILLAEQKAIQNAKTAPPITTTSDLAEFNSLWQSWKAGKQTQAIARAITYLQKNPNDAAIALSLGQFYFLQKKYSQASQEILQLLTKNPSYVAARTTLMDVYLAQKYYRKAQIILQQGLVLSPTDRSLEHYKQLIRDAQKTKQPATPKEITLPPQFTSYIEGGALYADLTGGYNHWFNQYLKTIIQKNSKDIWQAEFLHGFEFNQKANYGLIQETHNFNANWYGIFSTGISDNSIYVPKYYLGGTLGRRLLQSKRLIVYLQSQAYWFRPIYKLEVLNPGLIYYFKKPWVVESGIYLNRSNPGRVDTAVGYLAVTQGRDKERYLTLRLAWGREGYLPMINNAPIVGYPSIVATGTWRQWLGKQWGWNIIAENYHNRFYNRYNISFGVFKEFSV